MRIYSTYPDEIQEILENNDFNTEVIEASYDNLDQIGKGDVLILGNSIKDDFLLSKLIKTKVDNKEFSFPVIINYTGPFLDDEDFEEYEEEINTGHFTVKRPEMLTPELFEGLAVMQDYLLPLYLDFIEDLVETKKLEKKFFQQSLTKVNVGVAQRKTEPELYPKVSISESEFLAVLRFFGDDEDTLYPVRIKVEHINLNEEIKRKIVKELKDKLIGNETLVAQNRGEREEPLKLDLEIRVKEEDTSQTVKTVSIEVRDISKDVYVVYIKDNDICIKEREKCKSGLFCIKLSAEIGDEDYFLIHKEDKVKEFLEFLNKEFHSNKYLTEILLRNLLKYLEKDSFKTIKRQNLNLLENMLKIYKDPNSDNIEEFDKYMKNLAAEIYNKINESKEIKKIDKIEEIKIEEIKDSFLALFNTYYDIFVDPRFLGSINNRASLLKLIVKFLKERGIASIPNFARKVEISLKSSLNNKKTLEKFFSERNEREKEFDVIYNDKQRSEEIKPKSFSPDKPIFFKEKKEIYNIFLNQILIEEFFRGRTRKEGLLLLFSSPLLEKAYSDSAILGRRDLLLKSRYFYEWSDKNLHLVHSDSIESEIQQALTKCSGCEECVDKKSNAFYYLRVYFYFLEKNISGEILLKDLKNKLLEIGEKNLYKIIKYYIDEFENKIIEYSYEYKDGRLTDPIDTLNRAVLEFWGDSIGFRYKGPEDIKEFFENPCFPSENIDLEECSKIYKKYSKIKSRMKKYGKRHIVDLLSLYACEGKLDEEDISIFPLPAVIYDQDKDDIQNIGNRENSPLKASVDADGFLIVEITDISKKGNTQKCIQLKMNGNSLTVSSCKNSSSEDLTVKISSKRCIKIPFKMDNFKKLTLKVNPKEIQKCIKIELSTETYLTLTSCKNSKSKKLIITLT